MKARTIINKLRKRDERQQIAYERKYANVVYKAILEQVKQYNSNGQLDDTILWKELEILYKDVAIFNAKQQYKDLDSTNVTKSIDLFLGLWDTWITTWANTYLANKVREINETTRSIIADITGRGANEGFTFSEIANQIIERFEGQIGQNRAKMIARTEVGNAVNMGKTKSAEDWESEAGIEVYKMWIHRPSREPRGWHYRLDDNKGYPKSHKWSVTIPKTGITDLMERPHDPNASAGNVINCFCSIVYVSKRFAERLNRNQ